MLPFVLSEAPPMTRSAPAARAGANDAADAFLAVLASLRAAAVPAQPVPADAEAAETVPEHDESPALATPQMPTGPTIDRDEGDASGLEPGSPLPLKDVPRPDRPDAGAPLAPVPETAMAPAPVPPPPAVPVMMTTPRTPPAPEALLHGRIALSPKVPAPPGETLPPGPVTAAPATGVEDGMQADATTPAAPRDAGRAPVASDAPRRPAETSATAHEQTVAVKDATTLTPQRAEILAKSQPPEPARPSPPQKQSGASLATPEPVVTLPPQSTPEGVRAAVREPVAPAMAATAPVSAPVSAKGSQTQKAATRADAARADGADSPEQKRATPDAAMAQQPLLSVNQGPRQSRASTADPIAAAAHEPLPEPVAVPVADAPPDPARPRIERPALSNPATLPPAHNPPPHATPALSPADAAPLRKMGPAVPELATPTNTGPTPSPTLPDRGPMDTPLAAAQRPLPPEPILDGSRVKVSPGRKMRTDTAATAFEIRLEHSGRARSTAQLAPVATLATLPPPNTPTKTDSPLRPLAPVTDQPSTPKPAAMTVALSALRPSEPAKADGSRLPLVMATDQPTARETAPVTVASPTLRPTTPARQTVDVATPRAEASLATAVPTLAPSFAAPPAAQHRPEPAGKTTDIASPRPEVVPQPAVVPAPAVVAAQASAAAPLPEPRKSREVPPLAPVEAAPLDRALPADLAQRPETPARFDPPPAETRLQTHSPVTPRQIAEQIAPRLSQSGPAGFDIALHPEELGHVRLKLVSHETGSLLIVQADRPETLDLMRRHISALEHELRALGHDQLSLRFSGGGTQGQGHSPAQSWMQSGAQTGGQTGHAGGQHSAQTGTAPPRDPTTPEPAPLRAPARDHLDLRL